MFLKKYFLFLVIGVVICSCNEDEDKVVDRIQDIVSLPIPLDTVNENNVKVDSVLKDTLPSYPIVEGTVIFHYPYCGGAAPTEEVDAEMEKEHLLTNSVLKLKNNSGEYMINTNEKGNFSIAVPMGTYNVFLTKGVNKKLYNVSPKTCENCLTLPITDLKIKTGKKVKIEFTFNCDPEAKLRP